MAALTFYDAKHEYKLDDIKIPSVSEILRFGSREVYGTVDQYTSDHAAERGTLIHAACEELDFHGTCDVDSEISPYVEAYADFKRKYSPKWVAIEETVYHTEHWYAGRLDRAGYLAGIRGLCLIDIKSTSQIKKQTVQPQLTAYKEAWEHMGREPVEALFALHLKRDGKYSLRRFDCSPELWGAYLTLHKSFRKRGEK